MNNTPWQVPLLLGGLLCVYALVDVLIRGGQLARVLSKQGIVAWLSQSSIALALCLWVLGPSSSSTPTPEPLTWLGAGLALTCSYNAATRDLCPVFGGPSVPLRVLLVALACASFFHPAALLATAALLGSVFGLWLHHATFPMRLLQALSAHALLRLAAGLSPWDRPAFLQAVDAAALLLCVTMFVSHYVITALAKGLLGPRPWSWPRDNRLHHLAASAYAWGWARFLPWSDYRRVVDATRRVEIPLQWLVFGLELTSPLALLDPHLAVGFLILCAAFHAGVVVLSGLLFWDWIVTDLLLAAALIALPEQLTHLALSLDGLLVGSLVLIAFPLRHRLWRPMPLGWYDSPMSARIHWQVVGTSGRLYGLYADFMCPRERLYGRVNGCFYAPRPVVTYHLGEVFRPELRSALVSAGPHEQRLDEIRARFGIDPRSDALKRRHRAYLEGFFCRLNQGAQKSVLPSFLKAPGDQLYYWGDLPAYRRQEPVTEVRLVYRECYYDGQELRTLADEEVERFAVPSRVPDDIQPEPSPRELDDYLMELGAGRLIRLSGFRGRYRGADDRRASVPDGTAAPSP